MDIRNKSIRRKKRVKQKKRKIGKGFVKKPKKKIKSKKLKGMRTRSGITGGITGGIRGGITINLNLAKPLPSLRTRRKRAAKPRESVRNSNAQPITNASQFRNQNTFHKPSVNSGNSLIELPRGGTTIVAPGHERDFGASGAMAQLQLDLDGSRRINTITGRNVHKEESDIRQIMQTTGNLATLIEVKKWLDEEGYKIKKGLRKQRVIDYILSSPELSKLFLDKDWEKKPTKEEPVPAELVPLLRPVVTPVTDEMEGRVNTRSNTRSKNLSFA